MNEATVPDSRPQPAKRPLKRNLLVGAIVVLALVLALPVSNLFIPHPSGTALTRFAAGDPARLQVAAMLERNCLDCHSTTARVPLYGGFPVAGSLLAEDQARALEYIDLTDALATRPGRPVSEVTLARLEYAIDSGTMPPARYTIMHWNRRLSAKDKDAIRGWIRAVRKAHYAIPGAAAQFETDVFQPLPAAITADPKKVALGNKLYHDVRLSGDETLSCASCHALDKGGTDQAKTSEGIKGQLGPINSPTVYNAVFNVKQFWDGRAETLQDQAGGPVVNPIEMGADFDQIIARLRKDAELVAEVEAVYPTGLSKESITNAIAEFESTLITPNSRFDQYLMGNAGALTPEELDGLRLFRENACTTCHAGRALGGQSFERMGRRADYFADRGNVTETDYGRFNVTGLERDRFTFKVPTLRNVALTYPYFHDGSQQTLEQAVASMARYQAYREFSEEEVARVVKFLKTLTGEYQGKPL